MDLKMLLWWNVAPLLSLLLLFCYYYFFELMHNEDVGPVDTFRSRDIIFNAHHRPEG